MQGAGKWQRWALLPLTMIIAAAVAISPVPFASNFDLPRYALWLGAGVLAAYCALLFALGILDARPLKAVRWAAALYGVAVIWMLLQAFPTPLPGHPIWQSAADAMGIAVSASMSVSPPLTLNASMDMVAYGIFGFVAVLIGSKQGTLKFILYAGLLSAVGNALFGIINWMDGSRTVLGVPAAYPGVVTGTFINRSNFATYCGMWALASCCVAAHRALSPVGSGRRGILVGTRLGGLPFWGTVGVALLLLMTTALTQSRGGLLATLFALLFLSLSLVRGSGRYAARHHIMFPIVGIACLIAAISIAPISSRIQRHGLNDRAREAVAEILAQAIAEAPLSGTGFGAFPESFRLVRDGRLAPSDGIFDKAHNIYLEFIFGMGIPTALLLFFSIFFVNIKFWIAIRQRSWANTAWPIMGITVTILAIIHSTVDFSFQIPAVATCFSVILGLASAQTSRRQAKS